jgi:ubiquinone/menaquinone biosynthesis C-methylase UbiE
MSENQTSTWKAGTADVYEDLLVPVLFEPFANDLVQRLQRWSPKSVLEIAAGTGAVTRRMTEVLPNTSIVATDLNATMLEVGQKLAPKAQWQQADASELSFEDDRFDAVVCQFGAMFFPDKPRAFFHARRVLKPGGRMLLNVWTSLEENDFARALDDSIRNIFPENPPTFVRSMPHGYADIDQVTADLQTAGFGEVAHDKVTINSTTSVADLVRGFCTGSPLRMQLEERGDVASHTEQIAKEACDRMGGEIAAGRLTALIFEATK